MAALMLSRDVQRHNETLLATLEPGDLIQFPRGLFSHWAVYVGDEKVVHVTGDDNDRVNDQANASYFFSISGQNFNKAVVKKESFWKVVADTKALKNNQKDEKYPPLSKREIVKNALKCIGPVDYNLLYDNCEHFASWCRYGLNKSEQAELFLTGVIVAGAIFVKWLMSGDREKRENW